MSIVRLPIMIAALAALCSCAYYNIYWTAEKEYKEAMEGVKGLDFRDPYAQPQVGGQSAKLIDSCINRCGKLLLLYPKSKWVDDALLIMGNCYMLKGDYPNALRKYDELITLYGGGEFADEARYMKAYTLVLDGSSQQASTLLEALRSDTQRKAIREKAAYLLARIALTDRDCKAAIPYLEAYLQDFPQGPGIVDVRLDLGRCLVKTGDADRAIEVLDRMKDKGGQAGALAAIRVGVAYRHKGMRDKAIELFGRVAEDAPDDSLRVRAKIETAQTLLDDGQVEPAIGMLGEAEKISEDNLPDLKAEIEYLTALIYERTLGDLAKASAAYDAAAGSKTAFGKMAKKRSEALKAISGYRESLADTTVVSDEAKAKSRFFMAETYLYDLGLRQKALSNYRAVSDSLPPTSYTAKSMLALAGLLEADNDSTASTYYRKVIDLFPETAYANVARSKLDLPLVNVSAEKAGRGAGADTAGASPDTAAVGGRLGGGALPDTVGLDTTAGKRGKVVEPEVRGGPGGEFRGAQTEPALKDTVLPPAEEDAWRHGGAFAPTDTMGSELPGGVLDSLKTPEPEDTASFSEPEGRAE